MSRRVRAVMHNAEIRLVPHLGARPPQARCSPASPSTARRKTRRSSPSNSTTRRCARSCSHASGSTASSAPPRTGCA
eukprot:4327650-Prymnesium_polylepis.1